jgi:hypothetical protein
MKTIEITVDAKGQTKVETTGFTGSSCRDASRFLEQALGRPAGETLTAAFYQQQAIEEQDLKQSS